jgi:hypothetical protein
VRETPLAGQNIIVLDCETLRSATDCFVCDLSQAAHGGGMHAYVPIGWKNHAFLSLSVGCYFSYVDGLFHWFDRHTLAETTLMGLVTMRPLLVTYNGLTFDGPLLAALVAQTDVHLADAWLAYVQARSYDLLDQIWRVDPDRKFERGLNGLGAVSQANGYGTKEMDGSVAPRLWREGRYADVLNYCQADVWKTRMLFEQVCATGQLRRGDGSVVTLPPPVY